MAIELRWRDLDHQGHVYHAATLELIDEARSNWLGCIVESELSDSFVVARMEIDYRSELHKRDQRAIIDIVVLRVGNTSLTLREVVRSELTNQIVAESITTIVLWNRETGKSRPLTDEERGRALQLLEAPKA